jgi:hypothetical protein
MQSRLFAVFSARLFLALALLLVGTLSPTLAADQPNPILAEMVEKGLDTGNGVLVKLPAPTMADGLDGAAQRAAIKSITDVNKPLERILAKGDQSPFQLKITPATGSQTAHHVDMWYVAYGSLETVAGEKFLKGLGPAPDAAAPASKPAQPVNKQKLPSKSTDISAEDLAKRGITLPPKEVLDERYGYSLFELMDRVYLSITSRAIQTRHPQSVLLAGYVDPRFINDTQYPDQWQPITQDKVGLPVLGQPVPYSGAGGYLKVTELKDPAGALFIEGHLVYNEPHGWFGGNSLLRSKIPILAKDNVVTFRQKLRKAEAEKAK